ncbi:uncharacterized protein LOC124341423 isoform X2 [Daphnia pulicaria]|uniref:uncharacterized protein LOC124341423 isoform X2 n=1 Tax=Daphnia pulicaria TaxID=35523 RepID=UPI001EEA94EC|nr:uncharacterized protein LOC124341423 isoform X2 [Daphnia pulicaria]
MRNRRKGEQSRLHFSNTREISFLWASYNKTNFDAERLGNHAVHHVQKLRNILHVQCSEWHILMQGTSAIQSRTCIQSCRLHGSLIYLCCEHHEHIHYSKF